MEVSRRWEHEGPADSGGSHSVASMSRSRAAQSPVGASRRERRAGVSSALFSLGRAVLSSAVLSFLAAGCVHYQPRPLSPSSALESFEARTLTSAALQRFALDSAGITEWPPQEWDIEALTLAAFYFSPDLDIARARLRAAEAGAIVAGQRPSPSLAVSEGYNSSSFGISPWIPEAALGISLETGGRRKARLAEAQSRVEVARQAVVAAAWQVRGRVRSAVIDREAARRRIDLADQRERLQARSVTILEAQLAAGEVSANEVSLARVALDEARISRLDADSELEQASIAVAAAIGVPDAAVGGLKLSRSELEGGDVVLPPPTARRRALTSRADILGALAEYEASQAALRLEVARQYPNLDLGGGYQLDQTDGKWTLSLGLPIPLLDHTQGQIAVAEAGRAEAAARFMALQAQVLAEIDGALASCRAAARRWDAADQLVEHLTERERSGKAALLAGDVSELDVVSVQIERAVGELARLEAAVGVQQAARALETAMEGPLDVTGWIFGAPQREPGEGALSDG